MAKPAWKQYEEQILEEVREWAGPGATIEFDQKLRGKASGKDRQIDILVTGDFAGRVQTGLTAAIDCKCYATKVNVTHVDKFIGFIDDVQTDLGILITNKGWSKAAEERLPRGLSLKLVEDEPAITLAMIDALPEPTYYVEWGDDHYESDFFEIEPSGEILAQIRYVYVERESRFPVDHPDDLEWLDQMIATEKLDTLNWSSDDEKKHAGRLVLRHYLGREPRHDEVESFSLDISCRWSDGLPWSVTIDEIRNALGVDPSIRIDTY